MNLTFKHVKHGGVSSGNYGKWSKKKLEISKTIEYLRASFFRWSFEVCFKLMIESHRDGDSDPFKYQGPKPGTDDTETLSHWRPLSGSSTNTFLQVKKSPSSVHLLQIRPAATGPRPFSKRFSLFLFFSSSLLLLFGHRYLGTASSFFSSFFH